MKVLLALKKDYKSATGKEWEPGQAPAATATSAPSGGKADELNAKITAQGDLVRELKSKKAPKVCFIGVSTFVFFFSKLECRPSAFYSPNY